MENGKPEPTEVGRAEQDNRYTQGEAHRCGYDAQIRTKPDQRADRANERAEHRVNADARPVIEEQGR